VFGAASNSLVEGLCCCTCWIFWLSGVCARDVPAGSSKMPQNTPAAPKILLINVITKLSKILLYKQRTAWERKFAIFLHVDGKSGPQPEKERQALSCSGVPSSTQTDGNMHPGLLPGAS
jgi:hypothetical protein